MNCFEPGPLEPEQQSRVPHMRPCEVDDIRLSSPNGAVYLVESTHAAVCLLQAGARDIYDRFNLRLRRIPIAWSAVIRDHRNRPVIVQTLVKGPTHLIGEIGCVLLHTESW